MLNYFKIDCVNKAKELGNYQKITIDELADRYCAASDAGDTIKKNQYMSALILRFWFKIRKLYDATKTANSGNAFEDFYTIVYLRMEYAFKYRAWQDPRKCTNAQSCINQALATEVKNIFYFSNLDKNKANVNQMSLDAPIEEDDDRNSALAILSDEVDYTENTITADTVNSIVQYYLDRKKIVEAIILDQISFNDTDRTVKTVTKTLDPLTGKTRKTTETHSEFWQHAAVEILSSLPTTFEKDFLKRYKVKEPELLAATKVIREAPNPKLYRYLRKTLSKAKTELVKFQLN